MKSGWLLLPLLLSGCAVEPPYPDWRTPPEPSPLSVSDVIKLLHAGIAETAIFSHVRSEGILSRPSTAEILALREAGATEGFIAGLLAAAVPYPDVTVSASAVPAWPPFLCWTWVGGRWRASPWPKVLEP